MKIRDYLMNYYAGEETCWITVGEQKPGDAARLSAVVRNEAVCCHTAAHNATKDALRPDGHLWIGLDDSNDVWFLDTDGDLGDVEEAFSGARDHLARGAYRLAVAEGMGFKLQRMGWSCPHCSNETPCLCAYDIPDEP